MCEMFEDTKGVNRSRKEKVQKDKQ